jgi:hypothetical protein
MLLTAIATCSTRLNFMTRPSLDCRDADAPLSRECHRIRGPTTPERVGLYRVADTVP